MFLVGKDKVDHGAWTVNGKVGTPVHVQTPGVQVRTTVDGELKHEYVSWSEEADPQAVGLHAYEVTDHGVLRVWAIPGGTKRGEPRELVRVYSPVGYSYVVGTTLASLETPNS